MFLWNRSKKTNNITYEINSEVDIENTPVYDCKTCLIEIKEKNARSWGKTFIHSGSLLSLLYAFLFFLELMGTSFKVIGGCNTGELFTTLDNPVVGIMTGVVSTVLLQSSSSSTSIIVSLVGSNAMTVRTAIPVVMGANIGTSVTNTLVSFGQIVDGEQFQRAFSGATVHDMFNYLSVLVLLPVEMLLHPLEHISDILKPNDIDDGEKWEGPVKQLVSPFVKQILNVNKDVIKDIAKNTISCDELYNNTEYDYGLIQCDDELGCPLFYHENASLQNDLNFGGICLCISIFGMSSCLYLLVRLLKATVLNTSTQFIKWSTNINPYAAILVGAGATVLVQSSSITTSVLTPLVGLDIIKLEQMYPLTLGANLGTTVTSLMASMVSDNPDAVQIALCHLLFNVFGLIIWFPIPFMRRIPLSMARTLGRYTRSMKWFPVVYLVTAFGIIPGTTIIINDLIERDKIVLSVGVGAITIVYMGTIITIIRKKYNKVIDENAVE